MSTRSIRMHRSKLNELEPVERLSELDVLVKKLSELPADMVLTLTLCFLPASKAST